MYLLTDEQNARALAEGQPVSVTTVPLRPNQAPVAHRLGRYLLIELLGRGGTALCAGLSWEDRRHPGPFRGGRRPGACAAH
jgi:hypothetical protein